MVNYCKNYYLCSNGILQLHTYFISYQHRKIAKPINQTRSISFEHRIRYLNDTLFKNLQVSSWIRVFIKKIKINKEEEVQLELVKCCTLKLRRIKLVLLFVVLAKTLQVFRTLFQPIYFIGDAQNVSVQVLEEEPCPIYCLSILEDVKTFLQYLSCQGIFQRDVLLTSLLMSWPFMPN